MRSLFSSIKHLPHLLLGLLILPWAASSQPPADTLLARRHLQLADSLKDIGQYDRASVHYSHAIKGFEASKNWHLYVKALSNLCANENEWGKAEKAITSGLKAVEVGTRELGENTLEVATALYVTAYAYTQAGRLDDARQHFEKCIGIMKSLLPEDDIKFAEVYEGYSEYFSELGDYDTQIDLLNKTLAIRYAIAI